MNSTIFSVILLLVLNTLELVVGQVQTRPYSCVLPSACRDSGSIIDPRILSPGGNGGIFPSAGVSSGVGSTGPGTGPPGNFPGSGNPVVSIVTPGQQQTDCPAGYVRCTNVICGTPTVQPSPQDGFATPNAFPWQAFLRNNNNLNFRNGYAGGGVLIDQYHVLTAAHKITNLTSVSVSLGVYNTSFVNTQTSQVQQAWIHSNYNQTYLKNDVAILRLATPVNLGGNVLPICLPQAGRSFIGSPSSSCIVSGWGQTSFQTNDAPTQTLKQVHVPIVTNQQCTTSYNNVLGSVNTAAYLDFPNEICAGGQSQQDACTQDGGSPLVCADSGTQYTLAGLVLWGKNCGQAGVYGVYLNVPQYANWIQCVVQCIQNTQNCNSCPAYRFL